MARKRQFDEVDKFDSVDKPMSSASVHGVLTSLSPVKKGQKSVYFDGTVSDGNSKTRLVGFSLKQYKMMGDFRSKKQAIQLSDCEIKRSWRGEKMELLLKASMIISESPRKIEVSSLEFEEDDPAKVTL